MDNRANNKGTIGNKGGRKPKADEIRMVEQMDLTVDPLDVWAKLWAKCQEGDTMAIKTWLQYRFGMPKQKIDHTTDGQKLNIPIIQWVK